MTEKSKRKTADSAEEKQVAFSDAVAELEAILHRIESEEIDIDQLADELKRATGLLEICRARVLKAEAEVTQVVQALAAEPSASAGPEDD